MNDIKINLNLWVLYFVYSFFACHIDRLDNLCTVAQNIYINLGYLIE